MVQEMSAFPAVDINSVPKGMEALCVSAHPIAWSLAAGPAGIVGIRGWYGEEDGEFVAHLHLMESNNKYRLLLGPSTPLSNTSRTRSYS